MLDIIPKWLLVQFVGFMFLFVALNHILFKPMLKLFKERDNNINGSLEKAKSMDKEKDDVLTQIETGLSETRDKAKTIYNDLSKAGLTVQKQSMDSATNKAIEINRQAREELEAEAKKVRDTLRNEVENFSQQIVDKMVGA